MSSGIAEIVTGPITGQQNLDSPELPAFRPAPAFHGSPLCYSLKRCPTAAKNQCRLAVEANIKTPRTLETQQQFDLITTLKPFAGQRFTISVSADEDSLNLVEVIRGILQAAGWLFIPSNNLIQISGKPYTIVVTTGVRIRVR